MLFKEQPQGILHSITYIRPVSPAPKAVGAAKRFYPAYLDLPDAYGLTPLQLSAWTGQLEIVQLLLESGCTARRSFDSVS